jgi:hypothetical protein
MTMDGLPLLFTVGRVIEGKRKRWKDKVSTDERTELLLQGFEDPRELGAF